MYDDISKDEVIKAIEESIEYWERDIIKPLLDGDTIRYDYLLVWASTGKQVECYSETCPLCNVFEAMCNCCPLEDCNHHDSTWNKFILNPCVKTARDMVYELKGTLEIVVNDKLSLRYNEERDIEITIVVKIKNNTTRDDVINMRADIVDYIAEMEDVIEVIGYHSKLYLQDGR